MHLHEIPFRAIERGEKKIEVRLFDEKRQAISVGDVIEFLLRPDNTKKIEKKIVALHRFPTFADFYNVYPAELSISDARDYYSSEDEQRYGVLAVELG